MVIEFTEKDKAPLVQLVNSLDNMVGTEFTYNKHNKSPELMRISAFINKIIFDMNVTEKPYPPELLNTYLSDLILPYRIRHKVDKDDPDERVSFKVRYSAEDYRDSSSGVKFRTFPEGTAQFKCPESGKEVFGQFIKELSELGTIPGHQFRSYAISFKSMFDAVYGEFFPNYTSAAYSRNEMNFIMMNRKIPAFIREIKIADSNYPGGFYKAYEFEECVWE